MTELKYKFTYDILCKIIFLKRQDLLKQLVAAILGLKLDSIKEFVVTNAEIPPEMVGKKFCRFDINMLVEGQWVSLEVQVDDQGDFPERTLYYWARSYSNALNAKEIYMSLPRVVVISIVDFIMFDGGEYFSEFVLLEAKRHELLTDKMKMVYIELEKLPKEIDKSNELETLLSLFNARSEEDLSKLEEMKVPAVTQAIKTYREIVASPEFQELERMRADARYGEASAIANAIATTEESVNARWTGVVAEKDAALADKDAALADKDAAMADQKAVLADQKAALADKDAEIARLRAQLNL